MKEVILGSVFTFIYCIGCAQDANWQHLDPDKDSVFGVSTNRSYSSILKGRFLQKVIVAVIDGGIDTSHEDLRTVIWNNPKEIIGNEVDDDLDGYVDDVHGWNFIGGKSGNVEFDNLELTRYIRSKHAFFDSLSYGVVPIVYRSEYQAYRKSKKEFDRRLQQTEDAFARLERFRSTLSLIVRKIGKGETIGLEEFERYQVNDEEEGACLTMIIKELKSTPDFREINNHLAQIYKNLDEQLKYGLNVNYDSRKIVSDDYTDVYQKEYGNNDVCGPEAEHGTHVAGIIGAVRDNGLGITGVASNVAIMCIRIVPKGDERDKDVANAIRYAVNHGARIINMSFGKEYSSEKQVVVDAIKYALSKGILFVHAAGNDGKDLDDPVNKVYPSRKEINSIDSELAWIEVGASNWKNNTSLPASFSNYGKTTVDVFAPGVHIFSTTPGSHYDYLDGTSMAAPMVTGVAALIWGYKPSLKAKEVKRIILSSATKSEYLSNKCISEGVVNAYQALVLANAGNRE